MSGILGKKEINFLDELCERWERRVSNSNRRLLMYFYKSESALRDRHPNPELIDFQKLKEDFCGPGKKFPTIRELINEINGFVFKMELHQARILLPSRSILIVHEQGIEKDLIMTIMRGRYRHTYKAYNTEDAFWGEVEGRMKKAKIEVPFTKMFVRRMQRVPSSGWWERTGYTKEEYGGTDLEVLQEMAGNRQEQWLMARILEKLEKVAGADAIIAKNFTYDPTTKLIHRVDVK